MEPRKEITIYDIAAELKLSPATVSRALQDNHAVKRKTRKNIQDTAQKLGYRHNNFASNLRKQKSNTIGVILHELNSHFITNVLTGIEKITSDAGYDLVITNSFESFAKEHCRVQQ
jgi:LacI family transcriptional regulator